ncbi:MAG: HaeIII family restriction endonuclease [Candidatus Onthomorpha sp.]
MSKRSNNQGRAYEYICLTSLQEAISKLRPSVIEQNSSYDAALRAWNTLSTEEQSVYAESADVAVKTIFQLEPHIIEEGEDMLKLFIQQDKSGEQGDVRDIVISRNKIRWEIGLSVKHNHFAVKHSRLSPSIDFGDKWFGIPCSQTYWDEVKPVFDLLKQKQSQRCEFNELEDKDRQVYIPLLKAFMREIEVQYASHSDLPTKMVEYLLGKYDFYKIISIDTKQITQIQSYNLHSTLNKATKKTKPTIVIPVADLPTRIISMDFIPKRTNTLELYLDKGWAFTFRIHNAERMVIPSLKFDIQFLGLPASIITINSQWK